MITAIEIPDGVSDPRLMALAKAVNGKTLLIFDPTDEETPVGLIRAELQGAYGNISNGKDSQVLALPVLAPESSGLVRKGSFTLTADGALAGDVQRFSQETMPPTSAGLSKRTTRKSCTKSWRMGSEAICPG